MNGGWNKGIYHVTNRDKYIGRSSPIFRSSWEYTFMYFCDHNGNILRWASEFVQIPYVHPSDGKIHTYYTDFYIEFRTRENEIKRWIVEVKPESQKHPPTQQRKTKTWKIQMVTYLINKAKWAAAEAYCYNKGIEFKIFTEDEIKCLKNS